VEHCYLHDLGAGGIRVGKGVRFDDDPAKDPDRTGSVLVDNNIIRNGGCIHMSASGIWIGHSADNIVSHNDVSDFFWSAISVGKSFSKWDERTALIQANDNIIEFNHIHHLGWGVLSDMGGTYAQCAQRTTVRNNVIHDVYSYDHYGRGGWGVYDDDGTFGGLTERNLVYRVKTGTYHHNNGHAVMGKPPNVVRNNVLALSLDEKGQLQRSAPGPVSIERNLVYWDKGDLLYDPFEGKWEDANVKLSSNLYWKTTGPVTFKGKTLVDWQKGPSGKDSGSIVADPLFVDPDNRDFRLRAGSPALSIGFVEWDYERAGIYDWDNVEDEVPSRGPAVRTHMGQPASQHVTLEVVTGASNGCGPNGVDFVRTMPDGKLGGIFRVPKCKLFMVTDVDWQYATHGLFATERVQTLRLFLESLADPQESRRVFESTLTLTDVGGEPGGMAGGTSEHMTSGFVISEEARLCLDVVPGPMGPPGGLQHAIVRGYLMPNR
jgi:hypothetical protein